MKATALLLVVLFTVSCSSAPSTSAPTSEYKATNTPASLEPKAVYLVQGEGVLSQDDLNAYPEVLVVHSVADFHKNTQTKVALWIDKNAIDLFRGRQFLCNQICKYWPVVLVGYSDPVYSFHDVIPLDSMFEGAPASFTNATKDPNSIEPGFSVWILLVDTENEKKAWNPGFPGTPAVQNILDITNPLLEGKMPDVSLKEIR